MFDGSNASLFINVERSTGSECTDFRAKFAGIFQSLSKSPQRIAGSGFENDFSLVKFTGQKQYKNFLNNNNHALISLN